jgi:hypothetical protein
MVQEKDILNVLSSNLDILNVHYLSTDTTVLVARYLRASLRVTKTHVGSQPAEVWGVTETDSSYGV